MATVHISAVGFLNEGTPEKSIGRLGMGVLPNGVSPLATAALVRLTCQAHNIRVAGISRSYDEEILRELASIKLIFWPSGDTVMMV